MLKRRRCDFPSVLRHITETYIRVKNERDDESGCHKFDEKTIQLLLKRLSYDTIPRSTFIGSIDTLIAGSLILGSLKILTLFCSTEELLSLVACDPFVLLRRRVAIASSGTKKEPPEDIIDLESILCPLALLKDKVIYLIGWEPYPHISLTITNEDDQEGLIIYPTIRLNNKSTLTWTNSIDLITKLRTVTTQAAAFYDDAKVIKAWAQFLQKNLGSYTVDIYNIVRLVA